MGVQDIPAQQDARLALTKFSTHLDPLQVMNAQGDEEEREFQEFGAESLAQESADLNQLKGIDHGTRQDRAVGAGVHLGG